MAGEKLSKRKLESYRRAEVVAQAARKLVLTAHSATQANTDMLMAALLDWQAVTGEVKYADPVRRGRKKWR